MFTESSKWRQKLISKRCKVESKATNLVKEINEKSVPGVELVTPEHFNKGVSPWDVANKAKWCAVLQESFFKMELELY